MAENLVFDEATMRKVNQLTLVADKVRVGVFKGERRSTRRGSSIEFADFRNYVPGDDLRRIDWNVYARLDRPFIKLLEEEEDLAVHLLIDTSGSMSWGAGDENKLRFSLRLAAGIGSITLSSGDPLSVAALRENRVVSSFGPARGQGQFFRLTAFLANLAAAGVADLEAAAKSFAFAAHRPGLVILISDLLFPELFEKAVSALQTRGHSLIVLHVLAPDELEPPLAGDLTLVDVETSHEEQVSLDAGLRQAYTQHVQAWQAELAAKCRQRSIRYLPINTAHGWEKILLRELRRSGIAR